MDAIKGLGLMMISEEELKSLIEEYLDKNRDLIAERKLGALGALMGIIMRDLRGKAKPELVNKILREKLAERLDG
jgi:glutamyl-tRNA(Gln) amidotransferase subunit E